MYIQYKEKCCKTLYNSNYTYFSYYSCKQYIYGLDILEDFVQVFSKTCRTKPTVWTFVTDLPGAVIFLSFQCYSEQTKGIQELSKITFPSFNNLKFHHSSQNVIRLVELFTN